MSFLLDTDSHHLGLQNKAHMKNTKQHRMTHNNDCLKKQEVAVLVLGVASTAIVFMEIINVKMEGRARSNFFLSRKRGPNLSNYPYQKL